MGCKYEMIMRPDKRSCGEVQYVCENYPDLEACTVTKFLGVPDNPDPSNCERSFPDHCIEPYVEPRWMFNGTWMEGNDLSCYEIKPLSDFRVTVDDERRHNFDQNFNGTDVNNHD